MSVRVGLLIFAYTISVSFTRKFSFCFKTSCDIFILKVRELVFERAELYIFSPVLRNGKGKVDNLGNWFQLTDRK